MKIVFATNNEHKLSEIRNMLGSDIEVVSLKDIGCTTDIPETGHTLEENAMQKAYYIRRNYGLSVFADDTGLEVDALGARREFTAHGMRAEQGTTARPTWTNCWPNSETTTTGRHASAP